jgi:hypothetical protein
VQDGSNIRVIDITHAARPWRWVRVADYVMVILCTYLFISLLISEITGPHSVFRSLVFTPLMIGAVALNLYAGWMIMGVISLRHHWIATLALLLLLPLGLLMFVGGVNILQGTADNDEAVKRGIMSAGMGVFIFIAALAGIVGFLRVRRSKIADLNTSLKDFLAEIERLGCEYPPPSRLPPRDRTRGLVSGFGGLGILSGLAAVPDIASGSFSYVAPVGWYLLLRSRAYFQPDFEHLIAADTRKPIIFLRSFADDRVARFAVSERTFIDFSLESRLADYFHDFGPFIAVASTKKAGLELGAARVQLSDDEWQAKVLNWMETSSVIVLFAGLTPWVNWELKEAVTGHRAAKLMVIFPASRRRHWWRRGPTDPERRLDAIRQDLADTVWSAGLNALDHPKTIRAITLAPSGQITVIRSRTRLRDSYHLAAMVAHFLILKNQPAGSGTQGAVPGIAA